MCALWGRAPLPSLQQGLPPTNGLGLCLSLALASRVTLLLGTVLSHTGRTAWSLRPAWWRNVILIGLPSTGGKPSTNTRVNKEHEHKLKVSAPCGAGGQASGVGRLFLQPWVANEEQVCPFTQLLILSLRLIC